MKLKNNRGLKDFSISWHDIDVQEKMTLRAFSNYLQEAAWQHANFLGIGFNDLMKHHAAWVLLCIQGEIGSFPKWNDSITIETWHKGYKGVSSYRDFYVYDSEKNLLARASSDWTIIDVTTRRPVRPQTLLDPLIPTAISENAFQDFNLIKPDLTTFDNETKHTVLFSELDFNGHVNNNRYFEWVANVFEPLNHEKKQVKRFEIHFMSECTLGDEIILRYLFTDDSFAIYGIRKKTGKKVFTAFLGF